MYTDIGLRLATAESVATACNSGNDGLNEISINLGLDQSQLFGTKQIDSDAFSAMELAIQVTTAFTSGTDNASSEFQLVSLPIALSLLADGAGGAADGKKLLVSGVAVTSATPGVFTINNHNLPLGTPIFLTSIATVTGISNNTVYFVVPASANTFSVATTFANALAGTLVATGTGAGTADVNFIPFVHATTGPILRPFLGAGAHYVARVQPYSMNQFPKVAAPFSGALPQPYGCAQAVSSAGVVTPAPRPYRYLALRHKPSAAMTAGSITADLVLNGSNTKHYFPSLFEVR